MKVLGIETSCDETAVAICDTEGHIYAHHIYSQIALHAEYGGVVPELASRDHIRKLSPLVKQTLADAHMQPADIDGVAWTCGPGLIGALLVGASFGRSLAFAWDKPGVGIHHMEGHLLAPLLEAEKPAFPFVALLVSGGHTLLVDVKGVGQYSLLGQSIDDAAGEAFDKTAKLLGLPYPGGPELAKLAEQGEAGHFKFPRPMTDRPGLDFSFSGLKTSVLTAVKKQDQLDTQTKAHIAHAFEEAVVQTLLIKCKRALQQTGYTRLVMAGGVSANKNLRQTLKTTAQTQGWQIYYPRPELCTDNGAMIAYAGALRLQAGQQQDLNIQAVPRWPLDQLTATGQK